MSVRVLFCCWPFEGHVFPQLSIALAARERGAEVAFFTDRELGATVESEGVRLFPFRRVQAAWHRVREHEREVGGRRQSLRVVQQAFREWLVETIPDQVADRQLRGSMAKAKERGLSIGLRRWILQCGCSGGMAMKASRSTI